MAEAMTAISKKTKQIFRIHKDKLGKRKVCSDHHLDIQEQNTIPKQFPEKGKLENWEVKISIVNWNVIIEKKFKDDPWLEREILRNTKSEIFEQLGCIEMND